MADPQIKFKRSSVASKRPTLDNVALGEFAINVYDGNLFTRVDTGGVGIATTVSNLTPWSENFGGSAISYGNNISISTSGVVTAASFVGDGSNLSGVSLTVQDSGESRGTPTTFNFGSGLNVTTSSGGISTITYVAEVDREVTNFVATAGQTSFTVSYTVGNIDVFLNGVRLTSTTDYTANNGTSVVLSSASSSGDEITVIAYNTGLDRTITNFVATAGQTSFTVSYTVGNIDVFLNGIRLLETDYTANNGTSVVLSSASSSGDEITIIEYVSPNTAGYWTQNITGIHTTSNIGIGTTSAFDALSVVGNVNVSGVVTATSFVGDGSNLTGITTLIKAGTNVTVTTTNGITTISAGDQDSQTLNSVLGFGNTSDLGLSVGVVTATSFKGDGSTLSNIPTSIVAGDNISISGGTGSVTITGLANTSNVRTDTLNVTGVSTFSGNVSIAGTLTYEDVTSVDSIGIVTARSGVRVTTGGLTVSAGGANITGGITGDLTGDVTGNVSGNAGTATSLATARTIAGVSFDGTADISLNNNAITNGAGYITTSITSYNDLSDTPTIPTNNNQLTNGAGYITTSFTNTNQLTNGAGFITSSDDITGTSAGLSGTPNINVGVITATGGNFTGNVSFGDDDNLIFGDSSDLKIFHDGDHSYISDEGQGNLKFRSNAFKFTDVSENKTGLVVNPPTGVEAYYNNTKRLETLNGGVNIVGTCTATLFSGDGSGLTNVGMDTSNVRSDTVQVGVITATSQFYPPSLTTAERDAITFSTGAFIFNETENKLQVFIGSTWASLTVDIDPYSIINM